jgi:hypothetical protein
MNLKAVYNAKTHWGGKRLIIFLKKEKVFSVIVRNI